MEGIHLAGSGVRRVALQLLAAIGLAAAISLWLASSALANHPVLVEGNCNNPPGNPFFAAVPAPGTCGDYDGDGTIGPAEDNDGDRVFGTINGANTQGSAATRINNNGTITVVTSGLFPETVRLEGNVTLEGAPGVEANIDAVRQGDLQSTARQSRPGIIIDAPDNRYVVVRNVQSRNWTEGIKVKDNSRVALEGVRVEHNTNYGIRAQDNSRVAISNSEVRATGFRLNLDTGDFPTLNNPSPGNGIEFEDDSSGTVCQSSVTGSFRVGIKANGGVSLALLNVFDNTVNLSDSIRSDVGTSCIGDDGRR